MDISIRFGESAVAKDDKIVTEAKRTVRHQFEAEHPANWLTRFTRKFSPAYRGARRDYVEAHYLAEVQNIVHLEF